MAHAEGRFTVSGWDESTVQELADPAKVTRASITQEFEGDLVATGRAELVMLYADDGTASFVGVQHVAGTLDGREGGFVLQAQGGFDGADATTAWSVAPGSGTGELAGLAGTGTSSVGRTPPGRYALDSELS